MIKKEMKEVVHYYCDFCNAEIFPEKGKSPSTYVMTDDDEVMLCDDCKRSADWCEGCGRIFLSEDDAFDFFPVDGNPEGYYCADCLVEEIDKMEEHLSAAKAFLKRHGVK